MKIYDWPVKEDELALCVEAINDGYIGGVSTDTVYGLVFDSNSSEACQRIAELKKRENDLFTFHIGELDQILRSEVEFQDRIIEFLRVNLPGPLTVIVKGVYKGVERYYGIRMPENPGARKLFKQFPFPSVVATSTNETGYNPLVFKKEVLTFLKNRISFCIFDESLCLDKKASTIIKIVDKDIQILRQGSLKIEDIDSSPLS